MAPDQSWFPTIHSYRILNIMSADPQVPASPSTDSRLEELARWLRQVLAPSHPDQLRIVPVSGDASFRRYFRVRLGDPDAANPSWIAMDAPPALEDCRPFCAIAESWRAHGVPVPQIFARDLERGFLLLSDFGDALLLGLLRPDLERDEPARADQLYRLAIDHLLRLQTAPAPAPADYPLPPYDRALLAREMELFRDWLVGRLLSMELDAAEQALIDEAFERLIQNALEQPQVCVHRDYHSRNLLLTPGEGLGILDFQDAVTGPYTYDLVSLLRDCYIRWPQEQVRTWALYYWREARKAGIADAGEADFLRWFDLMGVQRHLKAAGIFARLSIRDGKHGYLGDVPRTLGYIDNVLGSYPEFAGFHQWLKRKVLPAIQARLAP